MRFPSFAVTLVKVWLVASAATIVTVDVPWWLVTGDESPNLVWAVCFGLYSWWLWP